MVRHLVVLVALLFGACTTEVSGPEHDEPSDFDPVPSGDGKADAVPATFNQHNVVDDALFTNFAAMDAADVQTFFEQSPYANRSWLADHRIGSMTAAQMLVQAAHDEHIHPLMLLARMQVESTLVSKTVAPTPYRINRALGCGCPDGRECGTAYLGLANQLECGAETMRKLYDASVAGTGEWRKGVSKKTLDPKTVTPANHATASLYAYTPWVLLNTGGNWLVWNVTRKYVRHAQELGLL